MIYLVKMTIERPFSSKSLNILKILAETIFVSGVLCLSLLPFYLNEEDIDMYIQLGWLSSWIFKIAIIIEVIAIAFISKRKIG